VHVEGVKLGVVVWLPPPAPTSLYGGGNGKSIHIARFGRPSGPAEGYFASSSSFFSRSASGCSLTSWSVLKSTSPLGLNTINVGVDVQP